MIYPPRDLLPTKTSIIHVEHVYALHSVVYFDEILATQMLLYYNGKE